MSSLCSLTTGRLSEHWRFPSVVTDNSALESFMAWYEDQRSVTYTQTYPDKASAAKDTSAAASYGWRIESQEPADAEDFFA